MKLAIFLMLGVVAGMAAAYGKIDLKKCYIDEVGVPRQRPNARCNKNDLLGWTYWKRMQYKYFNQRFSHEDAIEFCKQWDIALCKGEQGARRNGRYITHPVSFAQRKELKSAIIPAFNDACVRDGPFFWTGASAVTKKGELVYSDGTRTTLNAFFRNEIPNFKNKCVAIQVDEDFPDGCMGLFDCDRELPVICKIQPSGH